MGFTVTRKLEAGTRIVVASHNPGKVWEINELIAPYGLDAISAGDLGLIEPEETEPTFEGNAKLKAVAASQGSGLPALADDSGLEVECLGGAPGIYSARWAGPGKDFGVAMRKVGEEITARHGWAAPGPRANFISVLCLAWPDGETQIFTGKVFGHLVWPPRGGNGFGYDPMFVADGVTQTYGEMEPAQKYANSHRTRAFAAFKAHCLDHIEQRAQVPVAGRDSVALRAAAASLSTQTEAAQFIARLGTDVAKNGHDVGHLSLDAYLTAVAARLEATTSSDAPVWRKVAQALLEASLKPAAS
ncbi:MAG: non-canonical purine NTP pyrophosphatase [Hyphomicrobium sp.]|nr:non-canonical purine NTP pyrophosphatase [Hyphomicrobium sp.]